MNTITVWHNPWIHNLGEAFVNLGLRYAVDMAAPHYNIYSISASPIWIFDDSTKRNKVKIEHALPNSIFNFTKKMIGSRYDDVKKKHAPDWLEKNEGEIRKDTDNSMVLIDKINSDFQIFTGMVFNRLFIKRYKKLILNLRKQGVKIIICGGGQHYSNTEIDYVRDFLKEITPYGLISRDSMVYNNYHDLSENSYDGIDFAFYVTDCFSFPELKLSNYVVLNFDRSPEPNIDLGNAQVIRTHHSLTKIPKIHLDKPNTLISHSPLDYLILYANVSKVHSDRMHACIATLAYGNQCTYYSNFPKDVLFDRVGINVEDIRNKLTRLDAVQMDAEKKKQIRFLSELIDE